MPKVNPIPDDMRGVIASLCVEGAAKAIEFYQKAFGAQAGEVMKNPDGKVVHASLRIATGQIMISDVFPQWNNKPTKNAQFYVYVEDCDAAVAKALKAGAKQEWPTEDMFWGDRVGHVTDPYGFTWALATHKEDVSPDEMKRRGAEWQKKMMAGAK